MFCEGPQPGEAMCESFVLKCERFRACHTVFQQQASLSVINPPVVLEVKMTHVRVYMYVCVSSRGPGVNMTQVQVCMYVCMYV